MFPAALRTRRFYSAVQNKYDFKHLKVSLTSKYVYHVELNRPEKLNALHGDLWREIGECFDELAIDSKCRAIIISGKGRAFSVGLDLQYAPELMKVDMDDVGRQAFFLERTVKKLQSYFTAIEDCSKPVIAAVHGHCIGAGIELISACDMRYSTADTTFQVKEVDIGIAADLGLLQRFPRIVNNDSLARELCLTARKFDGNMAKNLGLVSDIVDTKDALIESVTSVANEIASKSPVAVQGTKANILYSRDHSVAEGLRFNLMWNASMLQSKDIPVAVTAAMTKSKPEFEDL